MTERIKREDPSTTYDHQMGGARTFTLCVTAEHTCFTTEARELRMWASHVRDYGRVYLTCFEVIMDGVLCDSRYFAGAVQHSELVHV